MFYAYIPLFPYMGANLGQMPAAAAIAAAARDSSCRPGYGLYMRPLRFDLQLNLSCQETLFFTTKNVFAKKKVLVV